MLILVPNPILILVSVGPIKPSIYMKLKLNLLHGWNLNKSTAAATHWRISYLQNGPRI
jgi:hypothetical protein